jgi:hypothetical protein
MQKPNDLSQCRIVLKQDLVELAGCHRAWRRAPAVEEEARGRRERIAEASQSLA